MVSISETSFMVAVQLGFKVKILLDDRIALCPRYDGGKRIVFSNIRDLDRFVNRLLIDSKPPTTRVDIDGTVSIRRTR